MFGKAIQTNLGAANMSRIYKVIQIRASFEKAFECVSGMTNYHLNRTSERRGIPRHRIEAKVQGCALCGCERPSVSETGTLETTPE